MAIFNRYKDILANFINNLNLESKLKPIDEKSYNTF